MKRQEQYTGAEILMALMSTELMDLIKLKLIEPKILDLFIDISGDGLWKMKQEAKKEESEMLNYYKGDNHVLQN